MVMRRQAYPSRYIAPMAKITAARWALLAMQSATQLASLDNRELGASGSLGDHARAPEERKTP
jgi:hypothetical protein